MSTVIKNQPLQLGDITLYGNRIGVVTHVYEKNVELALNDGTDATPLMEEVDLVVKAEDVVKQLEKQICVLAQ